jgi:hypothetical protein
MIMQVGCDCNAKVATNALSCFRETPLFRLLKSRVLPEWLHTVTDEEYKPLSAECNYKILTLYRQHQLNYAKNQDWQNLEDWEGSERITGKSIGYDCLQVWNYMVPC